MGKRPVESFVSWKKPTESRRGGNIGSVEGVPSGRGKKQLLQVSTPRLTPQSSPTSAVGPRLGAQEGRNPTKNYFGRQGRQSQESPAAASMDATKNQGK